MDNMDNSANSTAQQHADGGSLTEIPERVTTGDQRMAVRESQELAIENLLGSAGQLEGFQKRTRPDYLKPVEKVDLSKPPTPIRHNLDHVLQQHGAQVAGHLQEFDRAMGTTLQEIRQIEAYFASPQYGSLIRRDPGTAADQKEAALVRHRELQAVAQDIHRRATNLDQSMRKALDEAFFRDLVGPKGIKEWANPNAATVQQIRKFADWCHKNLGISQQDIRECRDVGQIKRWRDQWRLATRADSRLKRGQFRGSRGARARQLVTGDSGGRKSYRNGNKKISDQLIAEVNEALGI